MMARRDTAIRLVPADAAHVIDLAPRLRPVDRIECAAMGHSAGQALRHGLLVSAQVWTALEGDRPTAMFGVVAGSAAGGDAIPWFLGSDHVSRHARTLITQGPTIVAAMHRHGRRLCNFVSSENRQAIRLLEHWGFTVEQDHVVMREVAFRRFIREIK